MHDLACVVHLHSTYSDGSVSIDVDQTGDEVEKSQTNSRARPPPIS